MGAPGGTVTGLAQWWIGGHRGRPAGGSSYGAGASPT